MRWRQTVLEAAELRTRANARLPRHCSGRAYREATAGCFSSYQRLINRFSISKNNNHQLPPAQPAFTSSVFAGSAPRKRLFPGMCNHELVITIDWPFRRNRHLAFAKSYQAAAAGNRSNWRSWVEGDGVSKASTTFGNEIDSSTA